MSNKRVWYNGSIQFGNESSRRSVEEAHIHLCPNTVRFCRRLRGTWEGRELSDQLFRSGTRVGANYRSATRGRSDKDFVNKLGIVVEEADEAVYWLELIEAAEIIRSPELDELLDESVQLSRIFNQSQLTAKQNAKARRKQRRESKVRKSVDS
jgi:four helix bundle protein